MLITFTDFGAVGPYLGQMRLALAQAAPMIPIVDLVSDAPAFRPESAARLLAALVDRLPAGSVVVAVVDPGVGGERPPLVLRADGRYFVGPGNGLLDGVAAGRLSGGRMGYQTLSMGGTCLHRWPVPWPSLRHGLRSSRGITRRHHSPGNLTLPRLSMWTATGI